MSCLVKEGWTDLAKCVVPSISRRKILKVWLAAGLSLLAGPAAEKRAIGASAERGIRPEPGSTRPSSEDIQKLGWIWFDYDISNETAGSVASAAASNLKIWRSISLRHLPPIDAPFDYDLVWLEAKKIAKRL